MFGYSSLKEEVIKITLQLEFLLCSDFQDILIVISKNTPTMENMVKKPKSYKHFL